MGKMELPRSLDDQLFEEVKQKEEQTRMPYIMYAERKGIREGKIEGLYQAIKILLEAKFGKEAKRVEARLSRIRDEKTLEKILYDLQQAVDLNTFEQKLAKEI